MQTYEDPPPFSIIESGGGRFSLYNQPMPSQLRTYTLYPGKMDEFVHLFREQLAPLRQKIGFTIASAWTAPETNQFIWLMTSEGPEDWETMDRKYFDSPERAAMTPNPSTLIAKITQVFVEKLET